LEFVGAGPFLVLLVCFSKIYRIFLQQNGYSLDTNGEDYTAPSENQTSTKSSKDRGGRWERVTFKIVLSYHGGSFDGWQKQPGLNTVQG
jgi:hypothetical protein